MYTLTAKLDGTILSTAPAFEFLPGGSGPLAGQSLWEFLTEPDAAAIQTFLQSGETVAHAHTLLNFVNRGHLVRTLHCRLERRAQEFILTGEPLPADDRALAHELLELNNRWALLVREYEKTVKQLRKAKDDLAKAMAELDESHWYLRKIGEMLPICMYCGKVNTGENRWEEVVEYLKANSLFLSHGCCPACLDRMTQSPHQRPSQR
jgi:hypothetical protein